MGTSTEPPSLADRYALIPGVGVGPLRFGAPVEDYAGLLVAVVSEDEGDPDEGLADYREYCILGLEEALVVYADKAGCLDSVSFYEFCVVDELELIDMSVGRMLVELGAPEDIDAEEIGGELELLYSYESLGLTIWTSEGRICVVQAGRVAG